MILSIHVNSTMVEWEGADIVRVSTDGDTATVEWREHTIPFVPEQGDHAWLLAADAIYTLLEA